MESELVDRIADHLERYALPLGRELGVDRVVLVRFAGWLREQEPPLDAHLEFDADRE